MSGLFEHDPLEKKADFGLGALASLGGEAVHHFLPHISTNLLGMGNHALTNGAEMLAQKGLRHGMDGKQALYSSRMLGNMLLGPEAMAEYTAAHQMGSKLRSNVGAGGDVMAALRQHSMLDSGAQALAHARTGREGAEALQHAPVVGALSKAIQATAKGEDIKREVTGKGFLGRTVGHIVDNTYNRLTHGLTSLGTHEGVNKVIPRAVQEAAVGGAGLLGTAGAFLANPITTGVHLGINGARTLASEIAPIRNLFVRKGFAAGVANKDPGLLQRGAETVGKVVLSPALFAPTEIGRAAAKAGVQHEFGRAIDHVTGHNPMGIQEQTRMGLGAVNEIGHALLGTKPGQGGQPGTGISPMSVGLGLGGAGLLGLGGYGALTRKPGEDPATGGPTMA